MLLKDSRCRRKERMLYTLKSKKGKGKGKAAQGNGWQGKGGWKTKGKGKGYKGGGKATPKGKGKSPNWDANGKFIGKCNICDQEGHMARECPNKAVNNVESYWIGSDWTPGTASVGASSPMRGTNEVTLCINQEATVDYWLNK